MKTRAIALFAALALIAFASVAGAQMVIVDEDFETMDALSPTAPGDAGWLVFANVFGPGGAPYFYGYGPFTAPNGSGGFCNVAVGEGGAAQGAQQLVVFSDYNNGDHAVGNLIEANTFREMIVAAADVGDTWTFEFDAKKGDIAGASTALAFIKTLDPGAGFALTNFITLDTTALPATWGTYQLAITIDATLVGQILQIGFASNASNYEPSGVFYDNVVFAPEGAVSVENETWGGVKSLFK